MILIFDFDGVILDSMHIRSRGFWECLIDFPEDQVQKLIDWHELHGGVSRFVKFRYFFEKIRNEPKSEWEIVEYTEKFSLIMRELLCDKSLRIEESISYAQSAFMNVPCYIASGSEQSELRWLCRYHGIDKYFKGIFGSPTPKGDIIESIIKGESKEKIGIMIGDSIDDYNAAKENGILFFGYNNPRIRENSDCYIESFVSCEGLP